MVEFRVVVSALFKLCGSVPVEFTTGTVVDFATESRRNVVVGAWVSFCAVVNFIIGALVDFTAGSSFDLMVVDLVNLDDTLVEDLIVDASINFTVGALVGDIVGALVVVILVDFDIYALVDFFTDDVVIESSVAEAMVEFVVVVELVCVKVIFLIRFFFIIVST